MRQENLFQNAKYFLPQRLASHRWIGHHRQHNKYFYALLQAILAINIAQHLYLDIHQPKYIERNSDTSPKRRGFSEKFQHSIKVNLQNRLHLIA